MDRTALRAKYRRAHGDDWWKKPSVKARYEAELAGKSIKAAKPAGKKTAAKKATSRVVTLPSGFEVVEWDRVKPKKDRRYVPVAKSTGGGVAYLWFKEGTSDKVYEMYLKGTTLTVKWGRRGSKLQSKAYKFDTAKEAKAAHNKLYESKLSKGYQEGFGPR